MKTAGKVGFLIRHFKEIFGHIRFIDQVRPSNFTGKLVFQSVVAFSFLILSVANIFARSYIMLILTALGFAVNAFFACFAAKRKSRKMIAYSSIISCSVLFGSFVISGGNDGFACLWVVLLPLLSMIVMDFTCGLFAGVFFQVFLIVVFWTPVRSRLLYAYNEQFCLRFPLFYLVTFLLGFFLAASLKQTEYNECRRSIELEEMNRKTLLLSRSDPLTKLANRRYTTEKLDSDFAAEDTPHCIVMGDVDGFKHVNDRYGHKFGDEALVIISEYITGVLPEGYLKSRWGGEEFLFAANESPDAVYEQVEKLRQAVAAHEFSCNGASFHITMTFGIASYTDGAGISEAINLADKRLYAGKSGSKNCTVTD